MKQISFFFYSKVEFLENDTSGSEEQLKTIENPLDLDLKRLFDKARQRVKFSPTEEQTEESSWSENLIREGSFNSLLDSW